ncbi:MAG: TolC family protein [Chlorobi bacterium]|nr:TolC family protein [Chlorobiota bacterium]
MKQTFYSFLLVAFVSFMNVNVVFPGTQDINLVENKQLKDSTLAPQKESTKTKNLYLKDAIELALSNNPEIEINFMEIKAKEAITLQQSLLPNPEVGFEIENFAGGGNYNAFKSSETTFGISQLIELGGKREKRTQAAQINSVLAKWDYEWQKLIIATKVKKSFTRVLYSQQQVELNRELLKLSEDFKKVISQRVEAGVLSPAELSRAQVEVTKAQIKLEASERLLQITKNQLASIWGNDIALFDKAVGELTIKESFPAYAELKELLTQNPVIAKISDQKEYQQVILDLQKVQNIPDPVVSAGYRRLAETSNGAVIAGIAIPLPVLNKNQGNIQEAQIQLDKIDVQEKSIVIFLQTKLNANYELLQSTIYEEVNLKEKIIPDAEKTYDIINQGYLVGKFTFLDVLNAQKTMFEAKENYLDALTNYQILISEIEGLIGQNIEN